MSCSTTTPASTMMMPQREYHDTEVQKARLRLEQNAEASSSNHHHKNNVIVMKPAAAAAADVTETELDMTMTNTSWHNNNGSSHHNNNNNNSNNSFSCLLDDEEDDDYVVREVLPPPLTHTKTTATVQEVEDETSFHEDEDLDDDIFVVVADPLLGVLEEQEEPSFHEDEEDEEMAMPPQKKKSSKKSKTKKLKSSSSRKASAAPFPAETTLDTNLVAAQRRMMAATLAYRRHEHHHEDEEDEDSDNNTDPESLLPNTRKIMESKRNTVTTSKTSMNGNNDDDDEKNWAAAFANKDDDGTSSSTSETVTDEPPTKKQGGRSTQIKWLLAACACCVLMAALITAMGVYVLVDEKNKNDSEENQKEAALEDESETLATATSSTTTITTPPTSSVAEEDIVDRQNENTTPATTNSKSWTLYGQALEGLTAHAQLGASLAMSGDGTTLAMGAVHALNDFFTAWEGSVHVVRYNDSTQTWMPLGNNNNNNDSNNGTNAYGFHVVLSHDGNTLATSWLENDGRRGRAAVQVSTWDEVSNSWTLLGDGVQYTGGSPDHVALSANGRILAAIINTDVMGDNVVRISQYNAATNTWDQVGGATPLGGLMGGVSAYAVALSDDGQTVAIGGESYDENLNYLGGVIHVMRYNENSAIWEMVGEPLQGSAEFDGFGNAIAMSADGSIVVAGTAFYDSESIGMNAGQIRAFQYDNGHWNAMGAPITGNVVEGRLGSTVALSADGLSLTAGAPGDNAGAVRTFVYDADTLSWKVQGSSNNNLMTGINEDDEFGSAVTMSADGQYVAGASQVFDGVNGENTGHVRAYHLV